MEGKRGRERPQRRWKDEVKDLLMGRRLTEREGMVLTRDREAWGWMVYRMGWLECVSLLASASGRGFRHPLCCGQGVIIIIY